MPTVLLDFDGVLTKEENHAKAHFNLVIDELSKLTGFDKSTILSDFSSAKQLIKNAPHKYGWTVNENITSFCEDLFTETNAVISTMSENNPIYKEVVRNKYGLDIGEFCVHIFDDATRNASPEFKEGIKEQIDELKKNADVIILSNSEEEKIKRMFDAFGINVRIIGNARKYIVDNNFDKVPSFIKINKFKIPIRRPFYFEKLNEFKEAIVVGDVFSLDLALPFYLKHNIVLMTNNYTPKWSKRYCKRHGYVIRDLYELIEIINNI